MKISKAFEESKKWVQNSDSKIVAESVKSYFPNFDTTSISNAVKDYQNLEHGIKELTSVMKNTVKHKKFSSFLI